ncbi:hypothetical protein [Kitasatospora sp. NPDC093806]|uniref:hypothetical protein n=1 Tax=Kitasatospora sp. NPDC093806 TaxID=3155075 RepID=UPI0034253AA5
MNERPSTEAPGVGVTVHLLRADGELGEPLAHGFLTSSRTVLVPDPPRAVADPWARYFARVPHVAPDDEAASSAAAAPNGGTQVLSVGGLTLAAVDGGGIRTAAAVLTLVRPALAGADVPTLTVDLITDSLVRHRGDQWAAFAHLGFPVGRPDGLTPPRPWWLDEAAADGHVLGSVAGFAAYVCCPSPNCPPPCTKLLAAARSRDPRG